MSFAVLAVIVLLVAAPAFGGADTGRSFGPFSGYIWRGHVTSVRASWTVPRVVGGSLPAFAGTWVGAQAPGTRGPFIQIGINEQLVMPVTAPLPGNGSSVSPLKIYYAFWSDTSHDFHPQPLFSVKAGDDISAGLTLTRGRWELAIVDATSKARAQFSTSDETDAAFNEAQWLQEDVTNPATGKPYPYPQLSRVGFRQLFVNSASPAYTALYSRWMNAGRDLLAPSPLKNDSFTLQQASITSAGAQYLRFAAPEDAAGETFDAQLAQWTRDTPRSQITAATTTFATALRKNIQTLTSSQWPARAGALVQSLVRGLRVLLSQLQVAEGVPASDLPAWESTWVSDAAAVGRGGHAIRRALHVPEIT